MLRSILIAATTAAMLATASIASAAHAAIAYSQSTGSFGYSWGYAYQDGAELAALDRCDGEDAEVVGWVRNGWCALAVGDGNGYGCAWGLTEAEAQENALIECSKNTTNCRIAACVYSG
jgi:hypothetical protein